MEFEIPYPIKTPIRHCLSTRHLDFSRVLKEESTENTMSWRTGLDSFLKSSGMDASDLSSTQLRPEAVDTVVDNAKVDSVGDRYFIQGTRLSADKLSYSAATDLSLTAEEREQIRIQEHTLRDKK